MSDQYVHGTPPHVHNLNTNTINVNEVDEYPLTLDDIDELTQDKILGYVNGLQETAEDYLQKHIMSDDEDTKDTYLKLANKYVDMLLGAKGVLAAIGIKVEYGWNDAHEWNFATQDDAKSYNERRYEDCGTTNSTDGYDCWPTPSRRTYGSNELDFQV